MLNFGPIAFASPWLLLGLILLPMLWLVLRAVPPAPVRRQFPGVALLLGLQDNETQTDRTPWWLLLLRIMALSAAIIGFAGPVAQPRSSAESNNPLLILADGSWASANDWEERLDQIDAKLNEASRAGRTAAFVLLTSPYPDGPVFQDARAIARFAANQRPVPFEPEAGEISALARQIADLPQEAFDTIWFSDGLDRPSRSDLLTTLTQRGAVEIVENTTAVLALTGPIIEGGAINIALQRSQAGIAQTATIQAIGLDPAGFERPLASASLELAGTETEGITTFNLPPEMRNRITRFEIAGGQNAGAVLLVDDDLRRREIALMGGSGSNETADLLSPLHYLRQALTPGADVIEGALEDMFMANPDVIILADVAQISTSDQMTLLEWVEAGGILVRFAGPRLVASDIGRIEEDPLMPVRLRIGGRSIGGAMSWGEPKFLAPFDENSPFFGLAIPDDVVVNAQVLAEPDPTLVNRAIAQLTDGTPIVTRKRQGQGSIILFHVTANAEWSTLPLSGLFVQMLERLAIQTSSANETADDLSGTFWQPVQVLDAFGTLENADTLPGVEGAIFANKVPSAEMLPGLYSDGARLRAVNTLAPERTLVPATWPSGINVLPLGETAEHPLQGAFLTLSLALILIDIIVTLGLSGRLWAARAFPALMAIALLPVPDSGYAQNSDQIAIDATAEVTLAYVITGDARIDEISAAGLYGLSNTLFARTSVEPALPMGVNIETDELAFFPFLYWPISETQPMPSREAFAKLNRYLRGGGMILFDTRDADLAGFGGATPEGRRLQAIARGLDIPPLAPIPQDHVLTRAFYLLQDFPGRFAGRDVWVEAAPNNSVQAEGMPFRDLNDGVTPVVIGGNDWAAAWAQNNMGAPLLPVGRGMAGERQREIALRFGVNLIMYVLTGNYKSDQVHVPALLDRLGQ